MALKYALASLGDSSSSLLPSLLPRLIPCLSDGEDEDVKNEAAACLLPVVQNLARQSLSVIKVRISARVFVACMNIRLILNNDRGLRGDFGVL